MSSKRTVHNLSRQKPSTAELEETENAFRRGPALACAILGATLLEYELEHNLRRLFKNNDDKTWGWLTAEGGPLATFHAKIVAGIALGLYDETVFHNLKLVKNIRNAFAHSRRILTFEEVAIRQHLGAIMLPTQRHSIYYKYLKLSRKNTSGQTAFIYLCDAIQVILQKHSTRATREQSGRKLLGSPRRTLQ